MKQIYLEIIGKVISKKNLWKPSRYGGIYPDRKINEFVDSAYIQIKQQLKSWQPIEAPVAIDVCFMADDRNDLDGMLTSILDLLENVKIIKNDRQVRRVNARREKVKAKDAKTFINIVDLADIENEKG